MKKLLSILLLSGILLQVFSKEMDLVEYAINKDFIASVLCVNKNVPNSGCEGKCHLKKELSKDDENQPGRDTNSKAPHDTFWVSGNILEVNFPIQSVILLGRGIAYSVVGSFSQDVFHPPGC